MNTVPLYHWSSLLHVHVHCMLQFSQFVLTPPSRSPWPFGGFPCDLSKVDLVGAAMCHPDSSEFVGSSEGSAQPEGTQTGMGVWWRSEWLSLNCMNCRQSVFKVFSTSVIHLLSSLAVLRCPPHCIISGTPPQSEGVDCWRVQWVPCQGSCEGDGKETWCGEAGCDALRWGVFNPLSFHCPLSGFSKWCPTKYVTLLYAPRLSNASLSIVRRKKCQLRQFCRF